MDIQEVKDRLNITTTKYDAFLTANVPDLVQYAKDYCKQDFTDDTGAEALPGPVKNFVARAAQYLLSPTGISSESAPGTNRQYNQDFPKSIMRYLKQYRKVFK